MSRTLARARQVRSGGCRRVRADQFVVFQFGPEVGGSGMAEGGHVLLHLDARDRAGDDRSDDRVAERELQRRGGKRNTMARTYRLYFVPPLQDLGASWRVIVHCAWNGASRENPGIVAAADDDPDASLLTARELALEHVLLEQRVAHR